MRSLRKFALVSAALGAGLLAACDEDVTSGSRSDAADAPADLLAQGPPDVPPFQVDTGPLPDGFYDRAPPPLPAGCPGMGTVPRLAQFGLWNAKLAELPTAVHVAPCVAQHCPHAETIIGKIRAKCGVEVIEGTHPFAPENIFG
jgi:hypothetical protein